MLCPSDCTRVVQRQSFGRLTAKILRRLFCERCADCCEKGSSGPVCHAPFHIGPRWLHMSRRSFLKASKALLGTASVFHLTHHWRLFSSLVPLLWLGESKERARVNGAHSQTLRRRSCRNHLDQRRHSACCTEMLLDVCEFHP